MKGQWENEVAPDGPAASDRGDARALVDDVLAEIRREGLEGVLTACYMPRSGAIRVAGVGTALEGGLLAYGVDYPADAASVARIRDHLAAFAWRRAGARNEYGG